MDDVLPPPEIGPVTDRLHLTPEDVPQPSPAARWARTVVVGLMFSVLPVLLTNYVLTKDMARLHPFAFSAMIPVFAVAIALMKPRERWYALGEAGLAVGERFFGQVRWEVAPFAEVTAVEVELKRVGGASEDYRFTGFRYDFTRPKGGGLLVEGVVEETPPRGAEIRLPPDEALPERHELRIARRARIAWERATGRKAVVRVL